MLPSMKIQNGAQIQDGRQHVFIDLKAAYDTVSRDGLMLKFMWVFPCAKLSNLLNNMLSNRFLQVFLGDKSAVNGVHSIMDYLKEVFWRRCCSTCTCTISHQHYRTSSNMLM
jgi:hypothetical protein